MKNAEPILVVIGNPPYNAFAGVSTDPEERKLVEPYKEGLVSIWGIKKFNLDELYVRFFRAAERRIAEMSGQGVVCYISNFSYLSDPSFVVMRQRLLDEFDGICIDCMNGDSRETGKRTPDGKPDPSVFSTPRNKEGIRVGTAVCLMVRRGGSSQTANVGFRHFWGVSKNADLLGSLSDSSSDRAYAPAHPTQANRFSFRPGVVREDYLRWPSVDSLADSGPSLGILENRRDDLISIDMPDLETRMRVYYDSGADLDGVRVACPGLMTPAARFDPAGARRKALAAGQFDANQLRRLMVRPMDTRWCYYTPVRPVWNEPRPGYIGSCQPGISTLVTRRKAVANPEGKPFFLTSVIGAQHAFLKDAYYIPVQITDARDRRKSQQKQIPLWGNAGHSEVRGNLSSSAREYLHSLGLRRSDREAGAADTLWMHVLAVGYSSAYLMENADAIREDWPRIPLPDARDALLRSAQLGGRVAALLDTERSVPGVTTGTLRPEIRSIGGIARADGSGLDPNAGDLDVTAGWGYAGLNGVTMPARGRCAEREYSGEELRAVEEGAAALGLTLEQVLTLLGQTTFDICLNDVAYWRNIPAGVWRYTIGGYQVMKKWLSYREKGLLGRGLTNHEAHEVEAMARRIAALLLLEPELDENYRSVTSVTYANTQGA